MAIRNSISQLAKEIELLKHRNKIVEADKAWETSLARKIAIIALTYFVVVLFFHFAGLAKPFVSSIVPVIAFFLSTLTMPFLKKMWLKYRKSN